jgi:aminopeptidase C
LGSCLDVFSESSHSVLSKELDTILKTQFREHALVLHKAAKGLRSQGVSDDYVLVALRAKKEQLMVETCRILTAMLRAPLNSDQTFVPLIFNVPLSSGARVQEAGSIC